MRVIGILHEDSSSEGLSCLQDGSITKLQSNEKEDEYFTWLHCAFKNNVQLKSHKLLISENVHSYSGQGLIMWYWHHKKLNWEERLIIYKEKNKMITKL